MIRPVFYYKSMEKKRVVLHADCNSFYASVESVKRPELKEVPMAVAGNPESRHGIILAKNELAKKFNIKTAETIWQAKKKCPDLVLVPPSYSDYVSYSKRVNSIYQQYTDLCETFGLDETFLDVTASLKLFGKTGRGIADELRERVKKEIGITISVGVSFNKIFAKLGSDYKKPDAVTVIDEDNFREFTKDIPVGDMFFVGPKTAMKLRNIGIDTIGKLASTEPASLEGLFGKNGRVMWEAANGLNRDPVRSVYEKSLPKSVGQGYTFPSNLRYREEIRLGASTLSEKVIMRMRSQDLLCSGVQVHLRDPSFHDISRQKKFQRPTRLYTDIFSGAMELINKNWDYRKELRAMTITAIGISKEEETVYQMDLFGVDEKTEKQENLEDAFYGLKKKYGDAMIRRGNLLNVEGKGEPSDDEDRYIPFHGLEKK